MTHRSKARDVAVCVGIMSTMLLVATGCAALASVLRGAEVIAPVASSALDLAARLAPGATPADLAEIGRRLDVLERCDGAAHAALAPDAGPTDAQRIERALIDSAAASRGLVDALAAARAGKDGGQ